jgi:hypothetical protein
MKFKEFIKLNNGNMVEEEWEERIKSTIPGKKNIDLFKNPTRSDFKELGKVIRFTANFKTKIIYAWRYSDAFHVDISKALKIKHKFDDPNLLTGIAEWSGGKWKFTTSDSFQKFNKMIKMDSERKYLRRLLGNDWSWANRYIDVDTFLNKLRPHVDILIEKNIEELEDM